MTYKVCGATKHQGDHGPCRRPAGWGTDHPGWGQCKLHGGAAPNNRKRALADAARDAAIKLGFAPVGDPLMTLASVTGELVAVKDYFRGEVERLTSIRTTTDEGGEQLRAELTGYQQALRDTVSALSIMAKLNIDERLAKISEAQAAAVIEAIGVACDAVGLDAGQRRLAIGAVRDHFAAA